MLLSTNKTRGSSLVCERAEKNMARGALAGGVILGIIGGPAGFILGTLLGAAGGLALTKRDHKRCKCKCKD